ncbi:MAG: PEP-CTERM sorting domain-containing protein [Steroidobacteraceae bacterium]
METIKNFIKTSPYGSCGGGGCDTTTHTETDSLSVLFSHLEVGSISATDLTDTGTFTAKYSGSELQCAMHDGVGASSSGQSDCLYWGSTTTFNGYDVLTDNLNDGYDLDIFLYNATDWDITSQIGFELVAAPSSVPEPATLALFAAGLAALGWTLSRRRKVS